ncbi:hypothetical protein JW992_07790 [candidate division KSB1 bacterium]|nr:hypothetical protein [candidate division KSB1 bacterium]
MKTHFFVGFMLFIANLTTGQPVYEWILSSLEGQIAYESAENSFSPFYSDIGLGFASKRTGIDALYLHYNRKTNRLGFPFLQCNETALHTQYSPLSVRQSTPSGEIHTVFFDRNSWILDARGNATFVLNFAGDTLISQPRLSLAANDSIILFEGYVPTQDTRDPDAYFPLIIGIRIIEGEFDLYHDSFSLEIKPDAQHKLVLAFSVNMLEIDRKRIRRLLDAAPAGHEQALGRSSEWFQETVGPLQLQPVTEVERRVLSRAVLTLAFNSCRAPGYLADRISQFPSRGGYPTHYLWDTCFHNLALEQMHPDLATDALDLLLENLRCDGKMAHFMCSTWMRPQASQPPLAGWACLRLFEQRKSTDWAKKILPLLIKNTDWWLTQRISDRGVIMCSDPLETGWDNTPRLDRGPVLALDMNTYLLLQIQACAELAKAVGEKLIAEQMDSLSRDYGKKMFDVFYDAESNLFYDVLVSSGEPVKIITPATFLPLLTSIPIPDEAARQMIRTVLLNPKKMNGAIPFPSVAYDEPDYEPAQWWRGPTWLAPAYLLLQVLQKQGFDREYQEIADRLYQTVIKDGEIHELFDSQTGQGLGRSQQGWTAAILIKLHLERVQREEAG